MKKILTLITVLLFAAAPAANAQAFLNKLKDKAGQALGNVVSEKVTDKIGGKIAEKTGIDINDMEEMGSYDDSDAPSVVAPDQQLQRRRTSTFAWNEAVTPSTAKFPIPLLNEFPAVPSAAELADPTEEGMINYYRAIKRVTLRAEELNETSTCDDAFSEQWREKIANDMANSFGMTRAEFDRFCDENTPEAEREKLEEKMMAAMFGGVDPMASLSALEGQAPPTEQSIQNAAFDAAMKVYQADPAETKYVTGKTPAELKALMYGKNPDQYEPELKAYEKAMIDKDGAAYKKRRDAFQSKLTAAAQQAVTATTGLGDIMKMSESMSKMESGMSDLVKMQQAMQKLANATMEIEKAVAYTSNVDAEFSASERKKLETIKKQIYATNDPKVYNPLYLQALDAIKSYRLRAASIWASSVQKHFNDVKAKVPAFIKTIREEVEAGYLPECALYRAPLNVVIECGDILEEAYSEFPSDYPSMYNEEIVIETEAELFWPEFLVGTSIDTMLDEYLFKQENGNIYRYNGGNWSKVPANFDYTKLPEIASPKSASWKSNDNKREVAFNAKGCWLQLPEGDVVYPVALESNADSIQWIVSERIEQPSGKELYRVIKCTYKL